MATNSNRGQDEDDVERGGHLVCDVSHRTRFVRDITFKIIPFCCFSLVIFSVGAVLVSTFAFDKPVPRQGTLAVSVILLSFFALFCIGFMYLYLEKFRLHVNKDSDATAISGQGHPNHRPRKSTKKIARTSNWNFRRNRSRSGTINSVILPGANGFIRSDTLRDPAPSPNTYNRLERELKEANQELGVHPEPGTTTHHQTREPTQQTQHGNGEGGGTRQPDVVRNKYQDTQSRPHARESNVLADTNATPRPRGPREYHAPVNHNTQHNQESLAGHPPRGSATQPTRGSANRTGPSRWATNNEPEDGHPTPSQKPSKIPGVIDLLLPTVPESAVLRTSQLHRPVMGVHPDAPQAVLQRARRRNGERLQYVTHEIRGPRPYTATFRPQRTSRAPDRAPAPSTTHAVRHRPVSIGSIGSQLNKTRNSRINERFTEVQTNGNQNGLGILHQPATYENDNTARLDPKLPSTKAPNTSETPSNTQSKQDKIQIRRKRPRLNRDFSFDLAESLDGIPQDTITQRPRVQAPIPIQADEFIPRHPSALPEPLRLGDKDEQKGKSRVSQNLPDYYPETIPQIPARITSRMPRPGTTPAVYWDEFGGSNTVHGLDEKKTRGLSGGGQPHFQVLQRASSEKFRGTPN